MSSGWSWSPTQALAQLNPNIRPIAIPVPVSARTTGTSSGFAHLEPRQPVNPALAALLPVGQTNENMPPTATNPAAKAASKPKPRATPKEPAPASKKRKSDADTAASEKAALFPEDVPEIDDEDPRLNLTDADTCNAVRRKIRNWIESGAMKIGEFQNTLGVSSKAYTSFMNRTGTWDGDGCDTYYKAATYFKKRELQGLPIKLNKPKKPRTAAGAKSAEQAFDVSGVELPGEANDKVPIFDTCDEIRKKIRTFLTKDGVTQAAFAREISKGVSEEKKVSPANLRYFMTRKGPLDGNTNSTFYAAYVFFEKLRVKEGKAKSKFREEMEGVHGREGVDVEHGSNSYVTCMFDERPHIDKYGKWHIVKTNAIRRR